MSWSNAGPNHYQKQWWNCSQSPSRRLLDFWPLTIDHCKLNIPKPSLQVKTVSFRQIKEMSMPEFRAGLRDICDKLLHIEDIDVLEREYNSQLLICLDRHAPVITKSQLVRPTVPWYNNSIKELKKSRRTAEKHWRKDKDNTRNWTDHLSNEISSANGDQKKLFRIIQSLTCVSRKKTPSWSSISGTIGKWIWWFFLTKIKNIWRDIDALNLEPPSLSEPSCQTFSNFAPLSETDVRKLIVESKTTSCELLPIQS